MPTVVLLDVSLSQSRIIPNRDFTFQHALNTGVCYLIDRFSRYHPLEEISLITFHSKTEILQPPTNDHAKLVEVL